MHRVWIALVSVLLCSVGVFGQQADNLYWVVETNLRHRSYTIVHFYNDRNEKVHEVRMQGVYLDIRNAKHRKKLDLLMKEFNSRNVISSKRRRLPSKI